MLALKFFILFPNLKLSFIVIVMLCTHSYRCGFTKNNIQRDPMGTIRRSSDSDSRRTKATSFIEFIDDQEPQIHESWCLVLYRISRKVNTTARVEVNDGNSREFVTTYLDDRHNPWLDNPCPTNPCVLNPC